MMRWVLKTAVSYAALAYHKDVVARPETVAKLARSYCNRVGKPLLNVGAGTVSSSLRTLVFGPQLVGDVNLDIDAPRDVPHGPDRVSYGDARSLPWPDKYFGAVFASHVLEHLDQPDLAILEWRRVADKVFLVTPSWWAPHTFLHPAHRWYISSDASEAYPLWAANLKKRSLPPLR
jgi:SAM-dependent methyltransferase